MEMSVTREIARPADEVFDYLADVSNNPSWQKGMQSCEWTSEPPIGGGSTYSQLARFMGKNIKPSFVVTEFEPGRRIAIKTVESTFPIQVVRRVEPTGPDSCRVSAQIGGGPDKGVAKLLAPIMARVAQKSVDGDYDRLVELLESSSTSTPTENSPSE